MRRYFQDKSLWWTADRRTMTWRWVLIVLTGILVACMGAAVQLITARMNRFKFHTTEEFLDANKPHIAYFSFIGICLFYSFCAGLLCWFEPAAAGSGIPEIKAYLNGVNLNNVVQLRVLYTKVIGMCLSVASGLPLGKEGPMIHAGSIIGAAVSQGNTFTFGFDTTWTVFQDFRNDSSKRDFVTFGAAAGIAAAFKAPIGGILFTLEEGASFWSTSLTFRAFFCALITQLTFTIIFNGFTIKSDSNSGEFAFGTFDDFAGFRTYELIIFAIMGSLGGLMGALFNYINKRMTLFRKQRYHNMSWRRMLELLVITFLFGTITFVFPLIWQECTPLPSDTTNWSAQQLRLLEQLVPFGCEEGKYNQLASLYFVEADIAMQQLYHFLEIDGNHYETFNSGPLFLFFIPYFFFAAITSGTFAPAGLFVPTLLAGAIYGRFIGHLLNMGFPGHVADSGTYALIGAAAVLGGMSRSTIAATVIVLEACGNNAYLLPLMLTFAAARYTGNVINESMYDMQIELKEMPFLEETLGAIGLLTYHAVREIMAKPVYTLKEANLVKDVYDLLSNTSHNGFPVVAENGRLCGFIMRKTLCGLLKAKAFSSPISPLPSELSPIEGTNNSYDNVKDTEHKNQYADKDLNLVESGLINDSTNNADVGLSLTTGASIFHDSLERSYPNYPKIQEIILTEAEQLVRINEVFVN